MQRDGIGTNAGSFGIPPRRHGWPDAYKAFFFRLLILVALLAIGKMVGLDYNRALEAKKL